MRRLHPIVGVSWPRAVRSWTWLCLFIVLIPAGPRPYDARGQAAHTFSEYPLSFELPAGWEPTSELARSILLAEMQRSLESMFEAYSGDGWHYYDRLQYLQAYVSPDLSSKLVCTVLRFPPREDYLEHIGLEAEKKIQWGKQQGIIREARMSAGSQVKGLGCFELDAVQANGSRVLTVYLFDAERPYQAVQLTLMCGELDVTAGDAVIDRLLETLRVDFTYRGVLAEQPYVISQACQKYLVIADVMNRDAGRMVIVIQEPHWDDAGQKNLFLGLNQFFEDNPDLYARSAIVAEGFPAGGQIDVWPLFEIEPECDETTLEAVLASYLIPGHVAFSWCVGGTIPVYGSEDETLYDRSARLWIDQELQDWWVSVVARNKSIAASVVRYATEYENPVLVVGGMHLSALDDAAFGGRDSVGMGRERVENLGIAELLLREGIGVIYLEPLPDIDKTDGESELARYRSLFKAQFSGGYHVYCEQFLTEWEYIRASGRARGSGVNVKPNVAAAVNLLSSLKKSKGSDGEGGDGKGLDLRGLGKRLAGLLRAALRGKGNFGIGKATRTIADMLGRAWVGPGARLNSDGSYTSKDGLRNYRPPSAKNPNPNPDAGGPRTWTTQANFGRRDQPSGDYMHNAHLTITD